MIIRLPEINKKMNYVAIKGALQLGISVKTGWEVFKYLQDE